MKRNQNFGSMSFWFVWFVWFVLLFWFVLACFGLLWLLLVCFCFVFGSFLQTNQKEPWSQKSRRNKKMPHPSKPNKANHGSTRNKKMLKRTKNQKKPKQTRTSQNKQPKPKIFNPTTSNLTLYPSLRNPKTQKGLG